MIQGGLEANIGTHPCLGFRAIGPKLPLRVLMWNSTGIHGGLGFRRFRKFPFPGGGGAYQATNYEIRNMQNPKLQITAPPACGALW